VYVIHPVIVVGATMIFEAVRITPFIKFMGVSLFSIVICYLLAHNLRKIPGVERIF
jgi:hypothetical protein